MNKKMDPNQIIQIGSWGEEAKDSKVDIEVYDSVKNCQYSVLVHPNSVGLEGSSDNEEQNLTESTDSLQPTVWNQTETLALINIFSLHLDKFKQFKMKKQRWVLISNELKKIGIDKTPEKCNIKWRNLLRSYRAHKSIRKDHGRFEFYNELNAILTSDSYQQVENTIPEASIFDSPEIKVSLDEPCSKRKKCCAKSEKQKRHEDRMSLLRKKVEIEERKVKAFEDYIQFLKNSHVRE
ncbi:unnamed protein product [Phaedon cochleariae]|uniref:Myb/SANT-like DNA-binding domain-containing protein n=1 Tax=Phaedon cochleariae TaxID=80249 RepID=A0A9N9X129_PHACE|nr:unnamed protein product [Phaedon cochleariae]